MKAKKILLIVGAAAVVAVVALAGTEAFYRKGRAVTADAVVYVPTGSDFGVLMDSVDAAGVISRPEFFHRYAATKFAGRGVRPGRYALTEGMTFAGVVNMLRSGSQSPVRVTFNNTRNMEALAGSLVRNLETDSAAMLATLRNDSVIASYGFTPQTFIAMFVPNTYELYWTADPEAVVERMNGEYERFWQERDAKLARVGLSRNEAVTLASIVYEETKREDEMARVAGVYINRLKVGMPLQADPTVKFALGDFALRRVLNSHVAAAGDSPYNTYKFAGLPPGPISMPSIAAVDAVLGYEEHGYYYFCASPELNGYHVFATNLAAHNRNAAAYHAALNRLGIR